MEPGTVLLVEVEDEAILAEAIPGTVQGRAQARLMGEPHNAGMTGFYQGSIVAVDPPHATTPSGLRVARVRARFV